MTKWQQIRVERVIVTLEGAIGSVPRKVGWVNMLDGVVEGATITFMPQSCIEKAEVALRLLFEAPGPLSGRSRVPEWLEPWEVMRKRADPSTALLRVLVKTATCTDESVFDPTLTHRLSFQRHFHGYVDRTVNWLMANPIGGDTKNGPRRTLENIRELSFAWGYGTVLITNLFTCRTKDLKALARFNGAANHPRADEAIIDAAAAADRVVLACGDAKNSLELGRYDEVVRLLADNRISTYGIADQPGGPPLLTKNRRPKHPLTLFPPRFMVRLVVES